MGRVRGDRAFSCRQADRIRWLTTQRIGDIPVHLVDERLSTVTATSHLREGGRSSREQRSVIDQAAAVVILQQFLDA